MEALEAVLEASWGSTWRFLMASWKLLEGLDGVLEAMLDKDSTKMTNKSSKSEKPHKNQRKSRILERLGGS